jgi:2,3,4,5-tetrahydropyridine-2-carboxylate N-succinyltransferase
MQDYTKEVSREVYMQEIENIWNDTKAYSSDPRLLKQAKESLQQVVNLLNSGKERSCYKENGIWKVNLWIKKAILLMFKLSQSEIFSLGDLRAYDKIAPRFFTTAGHEDFAGIRVVPNAYVRNGVFLGQGVILMPSFVNVGAYIDCSTMIDSMVTVGSCAQIGRNCHIASAVTIAGVLEPMSEMPVIIEDNCFIGAGSQISEGVLIE